MVFGIIFFNLLVEPAVAQDHVTERKKIAESGFARAAGFYDRAMGPNSVLFTGKIYNKEYHAIRGHQYFPDNRWMIGNVSVKEITFDSIYLMYDIYNNMLLAQHFDSQGRLAPVILYNRTVNNFEIEDHKFVRIASDTGANIPTDFYEELYAGHHVMLYAQRKKKIMTSTELGMPAGEFVSTDAWYFKIGNRYFKAGSRQLILRAMADHKKEIRSFMNSKAILYREELEDNLPGIAAYYDTLF